MSKNNKLHQVTAKIIIALLILSFTLWGISDVFRQKMAPHAIQIGNTKISNNQLNYRINIIKNNLKNSGISDQEINNLSLRNIAINLITEETLINKEGGGLKLKIDDDSVAYSIVNNPVFYDQSGKFNKQNYKYILRNNNLTEKQYVKNVENRIIKEILTESLKTDIFNFNNLSNIQYQYLTQERKLKIITFNLNSQKNISFQPNETDLISFYEKHKELFKQEEARNIEYIDFSCKNIALKINPSMEELKTEYNANLNHYSNAEKREILQLFFKDNDSASQAFKSLNKGNTFQEVAKSFNISQEILNLGYQEKQHILQEFQDPIFNLGVKKFTNIIKGPFGWHIFYVNNIKPKKVFAFKKVKEQIRKSLINSKSCDLALKNFNKAEDLISGGMNLTEISKQFNIPLNKTTLSTKQNIALSTINQNYPKEHPEIITKMFNQKDIHQDITYAHNDQIFILYNIKNIRQERYKTLDEVKGSVINEWRLDQKRINTLNKAHDIFNKIGNNNNYNNIISRSPYISKSNITINKNSTLFPKEIIEKIFNLKISEATKPFYDDQTNSYKIIVLQSIKQGNTTNYQEQKIKKDIMESTSKYLNDTIYDQYIRYLYSKYSVTVNNGSQ